MENKLESGPIIDIAHFERMTMGDRSLMSEILSLFREQVDMWTKLLDPNVSTPDFMVGAHTIKGSARGIGAWNLGEICNAAEEAAKSMPLSKDQKYIWREQILQELDKVIIEVANIEHKLAIESLKS